MHTERQLTCVIPGSFDKAKPEIDKTIDEFKQLGVKVLAPDKGWLYRPPGKRNLPFRPLPSEIGLTIKQIEESFLEKLYKSDFVYLLDLNGYIGDTAAFEIGNAKASNIPIFSAYPISSLIEDEHKNFTDIPVMTPQEVVNHLLSLKE